jgi:hypothetical protein
MKKVLLVGIFILFLLSFFTKNIFAQGTFTCRWNPNNNWCNPDALGNSCDTGYSIDPNKCTPLSKTTCASTQTCVAGPQPTYNPAYYPNVNNSTPTSTSVTCPDNPNGIETAIGCIPVLGANGTTDFLTFILRWAVGIGGGIAFLLILYSGFMIMTSSGNPERLKAGQELLTSAISGLILLIFSVFILKFIGVDILGLGSFGFGSSSTTTPTCVVNNVCKTASQTCCSGNSRAVSGALCPSGQQCIQ